MRQDFVFESLQAGHKKSQNLKIILLSPSYEAHLPIEFSMRSDACDPPTAEDEDAVIELGGRRGEGVQGRLSGWSRGAKEDRKDRVDVPPWGSHVQLQRVAMVGTKW